MVKRQSYVLQNTTQRTVVIIKPFGTDESVPYANAGRCTFQCTAPKSLPFGTDKSVPYAHDWRISYILINFTPLMLLEADVLSRPLRISFLTVWGQATRPTESIWFSL